MRLRSMLIGLVAALGLAAVPRAARADVRGWTLCTPGAFHSCHSIQITTSAVFAGDVRTGTTVTIDLHNLNGQNPNDNTLWSGLYQAYFWGNNAGQGGAFEAPSSGVAAVTSGGATGSTIYNWYANGDAGGAGYVSVYSNGIDGVIGGCTPNGSPPPYVTLLTCGTSAMASFSFTTGNIFDAAGFETAYILAIDPEDLSRDGCFSDPSKFGEAPNIYPKCDVLGDSFNVTPEPVTIALLGSGLFGVAGARLRRRKKDAAAE